jgi:outer membrane protein, heavy metal efflux system
MASTATPRTIIKIVAATLFFTFALTGILSEPATRASAFQEPPVSKNPVSATQQNIALGLDHFTAHCANCHGANGKADTETGKKLGAANLTLEKTQAKSDAELFGIISNGVPGTRMPAFGKSHEPTEIWQTILFVRKLPTLTEAERNTLEAAIPADARHKHETKKDSETQQHEHHEEKENPPAQPAAPGQHAGHQATETTPQQTRVLGPPMTLADLERMASQNNPTLAQAESAIRASQGRRRQAGMWPNPTVGYQLEEGSFRAFNEKSEHSFFIEQTIPLGGKLGKSRRIFEQEVAQAEIEAAAQKQRVLNTVRMLYYEALGAQQRLDLRAELARIAREAVKTTSELLNVGQADRPDYLTSEIEAKQVELDLINAENEFEQVWRLLTSAAGSPDIKPARLVGNLEEGLPRLDQDTLMATLLRESPEIKSARAEVERARAVLARARAERVPDLFLRGGIGYSNERLETSTGPSDRKTGPEASIEIGITLPIFNRNQGGITAAQAELAIAERELNRLDLALRVRLARAFRDYNNARSAVERYRLVMLPRAERAYQMYLASFRQMAAAYPQVLISQRTMFQVREDYLDALVSLRQNAISIEGFLLTGALDPPRMRSTERERVEMTGVRSGAQGGSNDRDR